LELGATHIYSYLYITERQELMRLPKPLRLFLALIVSISISNMPKVAFASDSAQMIATSVVTAQLSRAHAEKQIRDFIQRADVQNELVKRGLSSEEAAKRLASLTDHEINLLTAQMEQGRYGGILVTILLIVLIIYLVKRI
jgi:hypothetical protein